MPDSPIRTTQETIAIYEQDWRDTLGREMTFETYVQGRVDQTMLDLQKIQEILKWLRAGPSKRSRIEHENRLFSRHIVFPEVNDG
jgi:hypothetical protein